MPEGKNAEALFGVATKKDRKFYKALEEGEEGTYVIHSGGMDIPAYTTLSK